MSQSEDDQQTPSQSEERFVNADIKLELQDALQEDLDAEEARIAELQKRKNEEAVNLKRGLTDADDQLDEYIQKVNDQADTIENLQAVLVSDRERCMRAREALEARSSQVNEESEVIGRLINQVSSLNISEPDEEYTTDAEKACANLVEVMSTDFVSILSDIQSQVKFLKDLQVAYKELEEKERLLDIREEEMKKRAERIEHLNARILEENEATRLLDEKLAEMAVEEEKNAREIDAGKEYIARLEDDISNEERKIEELSAYLADCQQNLNEVEQRCKAVQDSLLLKKAEGKRLSEELTDWRSLEARLQWEKKQQLQLMQKKQEWLMSKAVGEKIDTMKQDGARAVKSEVVTGVERIARIPERTNKSSKKNNKEPLDETNGTIIFDHQQLIASTPFVSPKRSDRGLVKAAPKKHQEETEVEKSSDDQPLSARKQQPKRAARKKGRVAKRPAVKRPRCSRAIEKPKEKDVYDFLESE